MDVNVDAIFPSKAIHLDLVDYMTVIVARILVAHILAFTFYFEDAMEYHISHKLSSEMNKKSEVVINILIRLVSYY
jgi:hypothetical protein